MSTPMGQPLVIKAVQAFIQSPSRLGTSFEGEVAAVSEAVERLLALPGLGNIAVLSDSTATLRAIYPPLLQEDEILAVLGASPSAPSKGRCPP